LEFCGAVSGAFPRRTRGPQCGVCIAGLRLRKPVLLYYSTEKKDLQGFLDF